MKEYQSSGSILSTVWRRQNPGLLSSSTQKPSSSRTTTSTVLSPMCPITSVGINISWAEAASLFSTGGYLVIFGVSPSTTVVVDA